MRMRYVYALMMLVLFALIYQGLRLRSAERALDSCMEFNAHLVEAVELE